MFLKITKSILIAFVCIQLTSCGGKTNDLTQSDPYLSLMSQELEELPVAASKVIEVSSVYNPGQGIGWSNEYLIVADNARNSLVLLHIDGAEISSTGRRGKGPGEFEVINQLHKGSDGFLYVLDRMQVRVSQFMIENDEIRYIHSFSPDTPDQKLLQEVYITESGFYALYNRTVNYATGENSYYLYRTDKQFNPKELLFEMDGGEQISLEPVGFVEHPLASQTLWSQNGNKFYILDSHHTTLQKINLENGDVSSFTIIKETDRPNSSNSRSYLEERLEPVIRLIPAMNDAIQESKKLPLHHSFFVTNGWTVISTYYAGSANGIVLLHEEGSPEVVYARVLPHFYPFAMSGKQLIGLNRPSQDQAEIKVLTLDW